jgi:hypothetical protein
MRNLVQFALFFITCVPCYCQNLVGYDAMSIKKYMKVNCSEMILEKVINMRFNYLKYSDNSGSRTLLFFLDTDSVCKSERIIIDQRLRTEKLKELNSLYKKKGENSWIDRRDGQNFLIQIKDEVWTSIVTIVPDK